MPNVVQLPMVPALAWVRPSPASSSTWGITAPYMLTSMPSKNTASQHRASTGNVLRNVCEGADVVDVGGEGICVHGDARVSKRESVDKGVRVVKYSSLQKRA
jgi:hypothetical protein